MEKPKNQTKFSFQRSWNPIEDRRKEEEKGNLQEISRSLKSIEKKLEEIEYLLKTKPTTDQKD